MALPLEEIIQQAILAPSVHNIQPVRWMIRGDRLILLRNPDTNLPHADPNGHDILISAGAALEGVALAASTYGLEAVIEFYKEVHQIGMYIPLASISFKPNAKSDPLDKFVETRASWRGPFKKFSSDNRLKVENINSPDCCVVTSAKELKKIAQLADEASLRFMSNSGFRSELVSWMRLSRSNQRWQLDGLNADAMNMNRFEAFSTPIILGKFFELLNALGLAKVIVSEGSRYRDAAGIMFVHRPIDEKPIQKGRQFYRNWLELERAGFVANVVAALADDDAVRNQIQQILDIPKDRHILTAFLFGQMPKGQVRAPRARIPLHEMLVTADKSLK